MQGISAKPAAHVAGVRVLVVWTDRRVVGLDPRSGRLYWEHPFDQAKMIIGISSPVFSEDYLFVSCFFDGSLLLRVNPGKLAVEK